MALTPEEQKELDQLKAMQPTSQPQAAGGGLTEAEQKELDQLKSMEKLDAPIPQDGPIDKVADGYLRATDYTSGGLRTAAGALTAGISKLLGKKANVLTRDDLINTAKGKAPILDTYLDRAGVPKGTSAAEAMPTVFAAPGSEHPWYQPEKGGILDVTPRGVASGVGDMILSPRTVINRIKALRGVEQKAALTAAEVKAATRAAEQKAISDQAASIPEKAAQKIGGMAKSFAMGTPTSDALDTTGKYAYKSAFERADFANSQAGKAPISSLLLKEGIWGTPETIRARTQQLRDMLGENIGAIEDEAKSLPNASSIPSRSLTREGIQKAIEDARSITPEQRAAGRQNFRDLRRIQRRNPEVSLDRSIEFKRGQQALADASGMYGADPSKAAFGGAQNASNAAGAAKEIERVMDRAQPGLGGDYYSANRDYGTLKNALPELEREAKRGILKGWMPGFWEAPAAILGGSVADVMGADPSHTGGAMLAAAALMKAARSGVSKTGYGVLATRLADMGITDPIARKYLLEKYGNTGANPWSLLNTPKKEDEKK
jgi:hypothetical protein